MNKQVSQASVEDDLKAAQHHYRLGNVAEAERSYRNVLRGHPENLSATRLLAAICLESRRPKEAEELARKGVRRHPASAELLNLQGVALLELGQPEKAIGCFDRAIALDAANPQVHNNRGNALSSLKRYAEALQSYDKTLALQPDNMRALNNRGIALTTLGRGEEALESFAKAIGINPNYASAYNNRGNLLLDLGRHKEAVESYDQALRLTPQQPDAHRYRAQALVELHRFEEALAGFGEAIRLSPKSADFLLDRGQLLLSLSRGQAALADFEKGLALDPNSVALLRYQGHALGALGRHAEADRSFEKVLSLVDKDIARAPDDADAFDRRARALLDLGRNTDAIASYTRAIALAPKDSGMMLRRGIAKLVVGDFESAWQDYEHRWLKSKTSAAWRTRVDHNDLTLWAKRGDIAAKRVLVVGEQGVGDEIIFASMLPDLMADAKEVTLECDPRLASLMERSFPGLKTLARVEPPSWRAADYDIRIASGGLGNLYRNGISAFPERESYLVADKAIVKAWKKRLTALGPGLKVGISWRGGVLRTRRSLRSIGLEGLRPVLENDAVRFVSLQYGDAKAEVDAANARLKNPIARFERSEIDDFDQLAGLIKALDLVISVQNAVVHLSGAVGERCWAMVPAMPEWRYGSRDGLVPWYGSVKLYRQEHRGDWRQTIGRVAADLGTLARERPKAKTK